jgi:hypothetical protein
MSSYDAARRKRAKRSGRETGCWAYISAEELERSGIDPEQVGVGNPAPFYRVRGFKRSRNGCTAIVSLYREP